jgi:DNA invertase Pin-like site-specific DNA recombinase
MIYGYVRVSSKDQNLARQLEAAKSYKNVDEMFCDKQSGKNFNRPEYERLKSVVKKGDEVIVKELDRLGRNKAGVKAEIEWFKEQGVILRILDLPTTLMELPTEQAWIFEMVNNILIEVMGAMAEQEREKIERRRDEGIAAMPIVNGKRVSTKTGNEYGRPSIKIDGDFEKFLKKQKDGEISVRECCEQLGISRATWYNKVRGVS